MPEHDNDSLSRFFQKASKEPEIEFNEKDWHNLEARLDAEATRLPSGKSYRSRFGLASVIAVLLFSSVTYFLVSYEEQSELNSQAQQPTVKPSADNEISSQPDTAVNNTENISSISPTNLQTVLKNREAISRSNSPYKKESSTELTEAVKIFDSPSIRKNVNDKNTRSTSAFTDSSSGITKNKNLQSEKNNFYTNILSKSDSVTNPESSTQNEAQLVQMVVEGESQFLQRLARIDKLAVPLSKLQDSSNLLLPKDSLLVVTDSSSKVSDSLLQNAQPALQSRWSIVAGFSPDFSTIGGGEYTAPGEAFGLIAHYHFSNKFSISTGVIKSNKKYIGKGSDYNPPPAYWKNRTNGIIPEEIEGKCNIVEVPVAVQYKVANLKRSSIFISGGVSSYFMRHESYKYKFETHNPGANYSWSSESPTRFLFSIANVSVGYEQNISARMAVGIEPYIKIPLTEIGWSNVKLFSTGASVTFRYKILKKKTSYSPIPIRSPD